MPGGSESTVTGVSIGSGETSGTGETTTGGVSTAAGGVSSSVEQFFDRQIQIPSAADQATYSTLIDGLVADGVWPLLDTLLIIAAPTAGIACTNLVSSNFQASFSDAQNNFTAYRGVTPSGTVSYLNTGFSPSAGVNFGQNSGLIGAWNLGTANGSALVITVANISFEIWPYNSSVMYWMVNSAAEDSVANATDASGWFVANRTSSNATAAYRNNTLLKTTTTATVAPESSGVVLGYGVGAASSWVIAAHAIGAGMTAPQMTSLYSRVQTCLHTFGAV